MISHFPSQRTSGLTLSSHLYPIPERGRAGLTPLSRWEGEDPDGGRVVCTLPKLNLEPVTPGSHSEE